MKSQEAVTYRPRRIYIGLSIVGGLLCLLFVWELRQGISWDNLLFLVLVIGFAVYNLRWTLLRAELTPTGVTVHEVWRAPVHVDFRQVETAFEAGRILPGISIVYYAQSGNGLIDMDTPHTLFLPALANQDEFLTVLTKEIPR